MTIRRTRAPLVSVARVITSGADKARVWMETGAIACDMESATIAAWARARGLAAAVVRGVSDTADHGVPADLAAAVGEDDPADDKPCWPLGEEAPLNGLD